MFMDAADIAHDQRMLYNKGMTTVKARRMRNRKIATEFVKEVNSNTFCRVCQAQPIEWHHDEHPDRPNDRVSSLRTQGASIERIQREMDRCVPLCRKHHMEVDGRIEALLLSRPYKKGVTYVPPKPCNCCGRTTPRTRNGKCVTCDNHWSGRRVRLTISCEGCHAERKVERDENAN